MAAPRHETVNDLQELLALAKDVGTASATNLLWFRGVSDAAHALLPGLYRGGDPANVLVDKENLMRSQFTSRSMPLLEGVQQNEWGFLFIMQHYGVPTRLLDWTENAFLGLYFALSVAAQKGFATDAAVWLLDPAAWNTGVLPGMDPPGVALDAENPDLTNYRPGREVNSMATDVVAMYARYNNPRITAQRGVFTVFGREKSPMDEVFDVKGLGNDVLIKAVLPRGTLSTMNDDLRILGFRQSMIYPDLAGLAKEIAIDQGLSS